MNTQQLTAEHHLLKALQLEAEGLYTEAISSYKRAYRLKPSLEYEKVVTFMVDGQEYDAHGQIVGVELIVDEDGTGTFKEDFTPTAVVPEKFEAGDPNALKYLDENGYVVISNAADKEQIEKAKQLFWEHVEFFTTVSRTDVSSWTNEAWPGDLSNGIVSDIGIGQSAFLWYLRTLPNVKKAFGSVWSDNDLLVSFDGCGTFRPVEYNKKWRTRGGWFHIDQNLYQKKGRHCVQGLMNLFKSGENDGGFVVVPQSHQMMERAFENDTELCRVDVGDYYRFAHDIEFWEDERNNHASLYSHQYLFYLLFLLFYFILFF